MTLHALTKQYKRLTPEERFRLILAASGREDEAERDRLCRAGETISLVMPDHTPWSQAFGEISMMHYIELLDETGRYMEMFVRADQTQDDEGVGEDERSADATVAASGEADPGIEKEEESMVEYDDRNLRTALASGFVLRTKAAGWKLFCERLNLSPYLLWEDLPGYARVRAAIEMSQQAAFTETGFVCWLNEFRRGSEPKLTQSPLTVAGVADANEKVYRLRSRWWGGDSR